MDRLVPVHLNALRQNAGAPDLAHVVFPARVVAFDGLEIGVDATNRKSDAGHALGRMDLYPSSHCCLAFVLGSEYGCYRKAPIGVVIITSAVCLSTAGISRFLPHISREGPTYPADRGIMSSDTEENLVSCLNPIQRES
jgi:hypothetical protein